MDSSAKGRSAADTIESDAAIGREFALSEEEAVKRAVAQIGLSEDAAAKGAGSKVTLTRECLPFLGKVLTGHKAWRVEFKDLNLAEVTGDPDLANPHITALVVILSPDTGNVLKVTSVWPKGVPRIATHPACAQEERQLTACATVYSGIPKEEPSASLADALKVSMLWSDEVKQIRASYVLESCPEYKDRAVWIVELRGFPPSLPVSLWDDMPNFKMPEDTRSHLRNVIDAKTGTSLCADTIPQMPMPPVENRY